MTMLATARPGLTDLGPVAQVRAGRLGRRLPQLVVGLVLYGVSLAMMVRGAVGLAPWDVLHSGVTRYLPITLGQAVIVLSFVVMLAWIPLREVPGLGTILNALMVGSAADLTLWLLDQPDVDARPARAHASGESRSAGWPAPSTSVPSSAAVRVTA